MPNRDTVSTVPRAVEGEGIPGLVSVVIPTYNRAYIIDAAVQSALAQRGVAVEVIVADDGSEDETAHVVARVAADAGEVAGGPRVVYCRQPNGGVSAARNFGMRRARGEFIALLDSDDHWMPWKLAAQVAVLRGRPDVGMVWTDMAAVDDGGAVVHERYLRTMYHAYHDVDIADVLERVGTLGELVDDVPPEHAAAQVWAGDLFAAMLSGNLVHTSTVLLRRSWLARSGGFDESLRPSGEDYEFHLRTTSLGPVALVDAPSTLYRIGHPDQLTGPGFNVAIARNDLRTILRWGREGEARHVVSHAFVRRRLAHSYAWLGEEQFRRGERRSAAASLFHSVTLRPGARPLAFLVLSLCPPVVTDFAYKVLELARELDIVGTLPVP